MKTTLTNLTAPKGMYGLAVEPWSKGEIYAVAANWAQASCPVLIWGNSAEGEAWTNDEQGRQVADFRHNSAAALQSIIRAAIEMSGEDENIEEQVESIVSSAVEINDGIADEE